MYNSPYRRLWPHLKRVLDRIFVFVLCGVGLGSLFWGLVGSGPDALHLQTSGLLLIGVARILALLQRLPPP